MFPSYDWTPDESTYEITLNVHFATRNFQERVFVLYFASVSQPCTERKFQQRRLAGAGARMIHSMVRTCCGCDPFFLSTRCSVSRPRLRQPTVKATDRWQSCAPTIFFDVTWSKNLGTFFTVRLVKRARWFHIEHFERPWQIPAPNNDREREKEKRRTTRDTRKRSHRPGE